jgi:hypothetical protein
MPYARQHPNKVGFVLLALVGKYGTSRKGSYQIAAISVYFTGLAQKDVLLLRYIILKHYPEFPFCSSVNPKQVHDN